MSIHTQPYGVGLAYRFNLHEEVMHYASEIDLLEIPTVDHIVRRRAVSYPQADEKFAEVLENFCCIAHGIGMSFGSVKPIDEVYMATTKKFLEESGIHVFSDHLAYTCMVDDKDISSFLGMPFNDISLDWIENNYQRVCDLLGRPFALENVSLGFQIPDADYTEPEFLREMLTRTNATLLLDVTNVYNNCTNFGMDPIEYIHTLPPDRISQIHLAGGHYDESGFLVDCHGYTVMPEVWDIYREAVKYTSANAVIIERDYRFNPFREVMEDVRKAREIFYEIRPQELPDETKVSSEVPRTKNSPLEFSDEKFANLRGYQNAMLMAITDDEFRKNTESDPEFTNKQFPMDDDWVAKFDSCEKLYEKSMGWKATDKFNKEDEARLKQWEWRQWAAQV